MNYGSLANTGVGIAIGGVVLNQTWLVAAAAGIVLIGALLIRVSFRRGKTPQDI